MTASFTACGRAPLAEEDRLAYPETRQVEQTDDYFGTAIADPYRWLEDDNAADTKAWVEAQNAVTFAYLEDSRTRSPPRAADHAVELRTLRAAEETW